MTGVGPRKQKSPKEAALSELMKDLDLLNRQKRVAMRILQELHTGYASVAKRIKASGDEQLSMNSLISLRKLSNIYRKLQSLPSVSPQESQKIAVSQESIQYLEAHLLQAKGILNPILGRVSEEARILGAAMEEISRMGDLRVNGESFFRTVGKDEIQKRMQRAKTV